MCKLIWLLCVKLYVSRTSVFSASPVGSLTTPPGAATSALGNDALKCTGWTTEE